MPSTTAIERHLARLRACTLCPHMRRPVVTGRPVSSRILLVGQAPGDKEPRLGRPFAWTAGRTLFKWFEQVLGWTEHQTRDRI
jgi:uracil-DNA glycosylase